MRRAGLAAVACAGAAVGVVAEQQGYAWGDLRGWLPDLLAGWALIGLGIALVGLRRTPSAAVLLLTAGFSWFAFNFATTGPAVSQWVAERAAYLHRGPLLALALALPAGRPRTRLAAAGAGLAWVTAAVWPLWDGDYSALLLAAVFLAVAAVGYLRAAGRRGRAVAVRGLLAIAILGAAIGGDALRSIVGTSQGVADVTVLVYAAAVTIAGGILFSAILLEATAPLAERAVSLERVGTSIRDALRDLLGDPRLEIGLAVGAGFVDDLGRPLAVGPGCVTTPVMVAGRQTAVVVHDSMTLDNDATRSAVLAAVGLASQRARLRAELDRQVDAVEASRRRLLIAEEEERRRLAEQLDRGPGSALASVQRLVLEARTGSDETLTAALDRASEQLARVRPELDSLVRGLGGVDADGLVPALERLATGRQVDIEFELADVKISQEAASALWFVCSESLANTVKHAGASSVRVLLTAAGGTVRLTVADDGRGGANPDGHGLVGLADRVAALGGRLAISSPPGAGTQVVAQLPIEADRPAADGSSS